MSDLLHKYDELLKDAGPAAVVLKQPLMSVEGPDAVIFPPTYAAPKDDTNKKPRYNIDPAKEGDPKVCAIDSIGSQANRVEPIFKRSKYKHLVPQIIVAHDGGPTNVLDAGHRIADAIVRFSELLVEIHNAFTNYRAGDPTAMAKLAPTSLVFGAWDSRGTQHKIPRLINLRIDATDVQVRTRSAQFTPATDYVGNGLIDEVDENTGSDLGFAAVPATGQLGGIKVNGAVSRNGYLNLASLQALGDGENPTDLQRYILGLALVAVTAFENSSLSLRQGCQLVADSDPKRSRTIQKIGSDGKAEDFPIKAEDALRFATEAAAKFGVGPDRTVSFDSALANRIRELWSDSSEAGKKIVEKLKNLAKKHPLTMAELDRFEAGDKDPLATVAAAIKAVKGDKKNPGKLPEKAKRGQSPVVAREALADVRTAAGSLLAGDSADDSVKNVCRQMLALIDADADTYATLKEVELVLKGFKRQGQQAAVSNSESSEEVPA